MRPARGRFWGLQKVEVRILFEVKRFCERDNSLVKHF